MSLPITVLWSTYYTKDQLSSLSRALRVETLLPNAHQQLIVCLPERPQEWIRVTRIAQRSTYGKPLYEYALCRLAPVATDARPTPHPAV